MSGTALHRPIRAARAVCIPLVLAFGLGCGTTRMTDTQRTATEQLLISNAVDLTISQIDCRCMAGKTVFFDPQFLENCVDRGYVVSSLRQHLLASGCILQEDRTKATYVIEARAGAVGTDRQSLLIGIPQMTVPTILPGQPSQIPEIPFAKKTEQNGVAKIAVFAYNRQTGRPVWQSGVHQTQSTAKDLWVFGTGPFQHGSIQQGTRFAGDPFGLTPFGEKEPSKEEGIVSVIPVTQSGMWPEVQPRKQGLQLTDYLNERPSANRLAIQGLIHKYVSQTSGPILPPPPDEMPSGIAPISGKEVVPEPMPAFKTPTPPNTGGAAETEPLKVSVSGREVKPDM